MVQIKIKKAYLQAEKYITAGPLRRQTIQKKSNEKCQPQIVWLFQGKDGSLSADIRYATVLLYSMLI